MERYLLFAGDYAEAHGGVEDLVGHYKDKRTARRRGEQYDWAEILDTKTGNVIRFKENTGMWWQKATLYSLVCVGCGSALLEQDKEAGLCHTCEDGL